MGVVCFGFWCAKGEESNDGDIFFFLIFQLIMEDGESRVILVFADAWH
jgi:hypothetical protein